MRIVVHNGRWFAMTFDEYWAKTWVPTSRPTVIDAAYRVMAEKAWNAAVDKTRQEIKAALADLTDRLDLREN